MTFLDRFLCGLTGHRPALRQWDDGLNAQRVQVRQARVWLKCECGFESPGWAIGTPAKAHKVIGFRVASRQRDRRVA